MFKTVTNKVVKLALTLLTVYFISFILIELSPIDPVQAYIREEAGLVGIEQREQIAEYWGINQPVFQRFTHLLTSLMQADFGESMIFRTSVLSVVLYYFRISFFIMFVSWVTSGIIGFSMGLVSGFKSDSLIDKVIYRFCILLTSVPSFWVGILLILFFSVQLNWFPVGMSVPAGVLRQNVTYLDRLSHAILPILTLSMSSFSNLTLYTRQRVIEVKQSTFSTFAITRGENQWEYLHRHLLRNTLIPAITIHFTSFGYLFGGSVLIEQVFSYPGLGFITVQAAKRGDMALLLGIVFFSTIFVFLGNTMADIFYQLVDPRVGSEGGQE